MQLREILRGASILCLFVVAVIPGVASSQPSPDPATVHLSFAWSPGMQASVTTTKTRTRVTDKRSSRSATSRYTLRVDSEGDDLRVHFADPTFEVGGDRESLPASAEAQIVAQIADLMPDYLVRRSGEFAGVHDLPAFQGRLQIFLSELLPPDLDSKFLAQIQGLLTSEVFLNSRAAEQWNAVVGAWVGAEFELGAAYTYASKEQVPVFPGQQILMNYSFSAKRLLPCRRGGVERSCAELEMTSIADPEDTKRMLQSALANLAAGELPVTPVFQTLEVENVIRVVTEPNGLIPHRYAITKTLKGTLLVEGKAQRVEQVDRTEASYAYP